MTLDIFVKSFVCPNTLIRLWVEVKDGHKMLTSDDGKKVGMEHQIINDTGWQAKYKHHLVIGVTDIICDGPYSEAVNIVICDKPVSYV